MMNETESHSYLRPLKLMNKRTKRPTFKIAQGIPLKSAATKLFPTLIAKLAFYFPNSFVLSGGFSSTMD